MKNASKNYNIKTGLLADKRSNNCKMASTATGVAMETSAHYWPPFSHTALPSTYIPCACLCLTCLPPPLLLTWAPVWPVSTCPTLPAALPHLLCTIFLSITRICRLRHILTAACIRTRARRALHACLYRFRWWHSHHGAASQHCGCLLYATSSIMLPALKTSCAVRLNITRCSGTAAWRVDIGFRRIVRSTETTGRQTTWCGYGTLSEHGGAILPATGVALFLEGGRDRHGSGGGGRVWRWRAGARGAWPLARRAQASALRAAAGI